MAAYRTLAIPSAAAELTERKSKFIAYAYPVTNTEQVARRLAELAAAYPDATHICYAYRLGHKRPEIRMNDDGEPSYSAGAPIFGQLEAFGLYDVLVCVVRYYGGTKLGVGGLIQAYREAARACLEAADIVRKVPSLLLDLHFEYPAMDAVMRFISQRRLKMLEQDMGLKGRIRIRIPVTEAPEIKEAIQAVPGLKVVEVPESGSVK